MHDCNKYNPCSKSEYEYGSYNIRWCNVYYNGTDVVYEGINGDYEKCNSFSNGM